jgi:hypothetical protein
LSRSANQRLLVEVLLLRWAMLDRTVELSEVIDALKSGERTSGRAGQPTEPPRVESSSPPAQPPASPLARSPAGPKLEPTLDNVRSVWPNIVADSRARSQMLGSLLAEAQVIAVEGRVVAIRPGHAVHAEGLERQRDTIAQVVGTYIS